MREIIKLDQESLKVKTSMQAIGNISIKWIKLS